ncbi:hypothetical protein INT44_008661 [Umbelopsis vinacea]|uniref:Uncharacterized protein n=1 Tax=Umbelopsis vinacea TaxID=44442 RepID=A0A8H7PY29_9FUNG|nr:hypothetical protein INT44_008661 [Umbelopsis vinacea]
MISRWSLFIALMLPLIALAQEGPRIVSPASNQTFSPGSSVDITFQYQNLGTGNYSVDIYAINSLSNPVPVVNITTGHDVPDGNSTGSQLEFYMNYTYSGWKIPHNTLNSTFWIVVNEHYALSVVGDVPASSVKGPALLLHNSLGVSLNPSLSFAALTLTAVAMIAILL